MRGKQTVISTNSSNKDNTKIKKKKHLKQIVRKGKIRKQIVNIENIK